jgi:hypothetical protein
MTLARKMSAMRRISARALHVRLLAEVDDLDDVDELVELLHDLLDDEDVAANDQGHARHRGVEGLPHGQALDVVAPGGEEPGHAREHAEAVLHENGDGVLLDLRRVGHG